MKWLAAPDPNWLPFLKILLGYLIFLNLSVLAAVIALGKVHQESSFGLQGIIGGLSFFAGGFSTWAFSGGKDS